MWQSLYADLKDSSFVVVAVAMDVSEAARPWIEDANPDYPCLIDRNHYLADLYNMVNVPQAVWIDEEGRIVRPAENAGSSDAFRNMDRVTKQMTPEQLKQREHTKSTYVAAVRDWVSKGPASEFVCDAAQVRARLRPPDAAIAAAHAHFRLALYTLRQGKRDEAATHSLRPVGCIRSPGPSGAKPPRRMRPGWQRVRSSGLASTSWETNPIIARST